MLSNRKEPGQDNNSDASFASYATLDMQRIYLDVVCRRTREIILRILRVDVCVKVRSMLRGLQGMRWAQQGSGIQMSMNRVRPLVSLTCHG